jgi:hypothetical protein
VKTKDVLINIKVNAQTREDLRIAAELEGLTMSALLHQFIVKKIHEKKQQQPEAFIGIPPLLLNGSATPTQAYLSDPDASRTKPGRRSKAVQKDIADAKAHVRKKKGRT